MELFAILDFFRNLPSGGISVSTVYWAFLAVGAVLALVSLVLGGLIDFAFDGHGGPLSGPVIASFLAFFGGAGLVFRHVVGMGPVASSMGAFVCAMGGSAFVYYGFYRVIISQQGGTQFDPADMVGTEAEVITGIPGDGIGEITFDTGSGRVSGSAKSVTKKPITRSTIVVIERVVGGTYMVRPAEDEPPPSA